MVRFTWKFWNRLNRKKNQISDFSVFYSSSYEEKTMKQAIPWMSLSANLFRLETSILTRVKRATNRNNVGCRNDQEPKNSTRSFFDMPYQELQHFLFYTYWSLLLLFLNSYTKLFILLIDNFHIYFCIFNILIKLN